MNISILAPTRNRPSGLKRMIRSAFETASDPSNIEMCLYIDDDDTVSEDAISTLKDYNIKYKRGERGVLSDLPNRVLELATADIFMGGSDDLIFRTKGWDSRVLETFEVFEDKIALVYPKSGNPYQLSSTILFLHRKWVDAVGYFLAPYFSCGGADGWWNEVSIYLNRRIFLPDVLIEHMHYTHGKSPMDNTYAEAVERGEKDNIGQIYIDKTPERMEDIEKLQEAIDKSRLAEVERIGLLSVMDQG